jgi:hypothetical protein
VLNDEECQYLVAGQLPAGRPARRKGRFTVNRRYRYAKSISKLLHYSAVALSFPSYWSSLQGLPQCRWRTHAFARVPDPSKPVGTICARQRSLLSRLPNVMSTIFVDTRVLEPGKFPQLPIGAQRVDPNDPLPDWIIPDGYVPGRADCQKRGKRS